MLLSFCFVCEMIIKQMMISFFPSIDLTANKRERGEDACSVWTRSYHTHCILRRKCTLLVTN